MVIYFTEGKGALDIQKSNMAYMKKEIQSAVFSKAFLGQYIIHFPQTIHFSASTTGKEKGLSCDIAFLGQTVIAGHL